MARLIPEIPLPPYTFVPGLAVHPNHLGGHSHGKKEAAPDPLNPGRWQDCRQYLYGLDLFNHGYYWEAHEAWEALWHASGKVGPTAVFLKGLIHLAAAGVKGREGRPAGVTGHARRAVELFERAAAEVGGLKNRYMGLSFAELIADARLVAATPPAGTAAANAPVQVVFDFALCPDPAP